MTSLPQSSKQIAINAAKLVARESNEVLKTAGEQIMPSPQDEKKPGDPERPKEVEGQRPKNLSFLNEYKQELNEIKRENLFKELQRKIAGGETVYLENYINELGHEQREVLKAQIEVMENRKLQEESSKKESGIPQIISKKARGMITGMVKKRNQQNVETRMPPSS
ncbi:MAG TPA: hypothetical protein VG895_01250 [Patescibacteria group bacterium]|nr:hypothetical protein [Patescibacteria group bacterium]